MPCSSLRSLKVFRGHGPFFLQRRAGARTGRPVDLVVHGIGHVVGQPGQGPQVLPRRPLHGVDAAQLPGQPFAAGGAQALDVVEDRACHPLAAELAVVGDGEAVGLVPDALEQVQRLGTPRDPHGVGGARQVDLLEALGQRRRRDLLVEPQVLEDPHRHVELALAPVHQQQLRRVTELAGALAHRERPLVDVGGQAAREHLLHGGEVVVAGHGPHAEPAVLGLLREPVLHHHHRADVVGALDVAHVVTLDAEGGIGQPERILQLVQRPGAGVVVAGPPQAMAGELLGGVAGDGRLQLPLGAALRHAHLDPRAPELRQPVLVELGIVGCGGHQNRPRHPQGRVVVEVGEDVAHHLPGADVLDLVEDEALAPHHPSPPHEERLDRRLEVVLGDADHVEVLVPLGHHLLALDGLADARQPVPHPGGALVLEVVRRGPHLVLEPAHDRVGLAVEEVEQLAHQAVVRLVVDLAHAGSAALLDVEQQARPAEPVVAVELVVAAGAQRKGAEQQVERLADGVGVAVGAEVPHALALAAPHHGGPGPLVGDRHRQERIALVVAQPDVEARPVLLDEAVLEQERVDLVADLDPLDGLGARHHRGGPRRQAAGVAEVVRQPGTERARLADVDDAPLPVLELVGPGGVGDRAGGRTLHHLTEGRAVPGRWRGRPRVPASEAAGIRDPCTPDPATSS